MAADELLPLCSSVLAQSGDALEDDLLGLHAHIFPQLDACIEIDDSLLDVLDAHSPLRASSRVALAADADEVGVDLTGVAFGVADDQAAAADRAVAVVLAAKERTLQVVMVEALLFPGEVVRFQQSLDLIECLLVDERLVLALVVHTPVAHDADVVGVSKHVVEGGDNDRLSRSLWRWLAQQAALGHFSQQRSDGPFAGGVGPKGPNHQRCALRIDFDCANLLAVLELADVQIARWCSSWRTAVLGFLDQALVDFVGQVSRVEFGDRAHDAVQQYAARRLIDVLGAGYEGNAGLSERQVDLHVVKAITGEPVDLVDDHVVNLVLGHVREHPLQLGSAGVSSAFAPVDKLLNHGCVKRCCFAEAGIALSRDREAFDLAAALGLFFGGDAQVKNGCCGLARFAHT